MNFLYRNKVTMELVSATVRTIKGKLIATITNISTNDIIKMDNDKFQQFFNKVMGKSDLSDGEIVVINKYFK